MNNCERNLNKSGAICHASCYRSAKVKRNVEQRGGRRFSLERASMAAAKEPSGGTEPQKPRILRICLMDLLSSSQVEQDGNHFFLASTNASTLETQFHSFA